MRKLKVKFDNKTGELVLRVHVHDFSDLRTQAELHIYDRLKETLDDETRAFYEGVLKFSKDLDKLIDMQWRPYLYEDDLPLTKMTKEERKAYVTDLVKERQLIEKVLEMALAEAAETRKAKGLVKCLPKP